MLKKNLLFLFAALILIPIYVYFWRWPESLPKTSGDLNLPCLDNKVDVWRDSFGVPHIEAKSEGDAACALGYTMAQDRLLQIDLWRRVGQGTLSEVFGEKTLSLDYQSRIFRFYKIMSEQWEHKKDTLSSVDRVSIDKFYQGMNYFIKEGRYPPEYDILNVTPHPVNIVDALSFLGYMSFSFSTALKSDVLLTALKEKLPPELWNDLRLPSAINLNQFERSDKKLVHANFLFPLIDRITENEFMAPPWEGSNSWVLASSRSKSHFPLLANDPHIGVAHPGTWYEAYVKTPEREIYGHYLSILPFPILGHTKEYAWGLTMSMVDDMDLYLEKIDQQKDQVLFNNNWLPLEHDLQKIKVRGGKDINLDILVTKHGPIVNELLPPDKKTGPLLSLKWSFYHPDNFPLNAIIGFSRAKSISEFEKAVSLGVAPGLNVSYADRQGHIAWWVFGKIPMRRDHTESDLILNGFDGSDEYLGYLDFKDHPQSVDPKNGMIVSANYYPPFNPKKIALRGQWEPSDRYNTIEKKLEEQHEWSLEELKKIQTWDSSEETHWIKDILVQSIDINKLEKENEIKAYNLVKNWDGRSHVGSAEASIYHVWNRKAQHLLLDELSDEERKIFSQLSSHWHFYKKLLKEKDNSWWDLKSTDVKEKRNDVLLKSFFETVSELENHLDPFASSWNWGKLHTVKFNHPLGKIPLLGKLFDIGPIAAPSAYNNPNNLREYGHDHGFDVFVIPSTRRLIDLGNPQESLGVLPLGQSGHRNSSHFQDQLHFFIQGHYRSQIMNLSNEQKKSSEHLIFHPGS